MYFTKNSLESLKVKEQIIKFSTVGFFTTVLNYIIFFSLYVFLDLHYLLSAAIGFICGVAVGFLFNKLWTFKSDKIINGEIFQYFGVYIFNLTLGLYALEILVSVFQYDPKIANIFVIASTSVLNFLGIKFLVFKK